MLASLQQRKIYFCDGKKRARLGTGNGGDEAPAAIREESAPFHFIALGRRRTVLKIRKRPSVPGE